MPRPPAPLPLVGHSLVYDGAAWRYVPLAAPLLSRLEFRTLRFTFAERAAVRAAARVDDDVGTVVEDLLSANDIDPADPRTQAAVDLLLAKAAAGVIDAPTLLVEGRRDEILAPLPAPVVVPDPIEPPGPLPPAPPPPDDLWPTPPEEPPSEPEAPVADPVDNPVDDPPSP